MAQSRRPRIPLVRDVLDKQIVDREKRKIGKVDGIVIALRKGRAPRVIALELGPVTLAGRLGGWAADVVARIERHLGIEYDPVRIAFDHVTTTGTNVGVEIDGRRTGALAWEDWLRDRIIDRIPGAERNPKP